MVLGGEQLTDNATIYLETALRTSERRRNFMARLPYCEMGLLELDRVALLPPAEAQITPYARTDREEDAEICRRLAAGARRSRSPRDVVSGLVIRGGLPYRERPRQPSSIGRVRVIGGGRRLLHQLISGVGGSGLPPTPMLRWSGTCSAG